MFRTEIAGRRVSAGSRSCGSLCLMTTLLQNTLYFTWIYKGISLGNPQEHRSIDAMRAWNASHLASITRAKQVGPQVIAWVIA